ncbi:hypothetical protein FA15DRAFT_701451 [Coprinopsis marcescibilis]|uniref:Uncharacterized protein n=1 Tax=Coprinopsis marcescibilis TaxID=230819 RepID=A0A5C3L5N6_COPMA|nr:hypothetical protein FA15DRAFT_701451 [Coprinopsis marcescibilis]
MSSTLEVPVTTQAGEQNGGSTKNTNNSNLYLVTFLATLFLLLFVSCVIVLRSYILRRRYQRQINLALANGIILTPRAQGSRRRKLGTRPRMYENWIAPLFVGGPANPAEGQAEDEITTEKGETTGIYEGRAFSRGRWCDMLPVTVQTVIVKRRVKDPSISQYPATSPAMSTTTNFADSPATVFPSSPELGETRRRPLLSNITPPTGFFGLAFSSTPDAAQARRTENRVSTIQFAEHERPSRLSQLPPLNTSTTPRERNNSATSTPVRERRDSATWRTIVSPNPSLPVPITSYPTVPASSHTLSEQGRPNRFRSSLPRWLPFSRPPTEDPSSIELSQSQSPLGTTGAPSRVGSKFRVRTEMLQISVLVAMPNIKTSRLYGDANVVKDLYGSYPRNLKNAGGADSIDDDSIKKKRRASMRRRKRETRTDESGDAEEIVEIPGEEEFSDDDEESESEEDGKDEEGDGEPEPLPDLVLGVTRLSYRQPQPNPTENPTSPTTNDTLLQPLSPMSPDSAVAPTFHTQPHAGL